jgi:general secretion pathway protein N
MTNLLRRQALWVVAGLASIVITVLIFLPASWLASMLETQTAGRLTLADVRGTLWNGSAYIGGTATNSGDPVTPILPGRFTWRISPTILLGNVNAVLEDDEALSPRIHVTGSWHRLQVTPGVISLPAARLSSLGAPLNTIQPAGDLRLSWGILQLAQQGEKIALVGGMKLEVRDLTSRLSPVKPLGSYELEISWQGTRAPVTLKTLKGPMLLDGSGILADGRLQFSGTARPEQGDEDRLANLLNLLGQHHKEGDKDVIALEFN